MKQLSYRNMFFAFVLIKLAFISKYISYNMEDENGQFGMQCRGRLLVITDYEVICFISLVKYKRYNSS